MNELLDQKILPPQAIDGFIDTLHILRDAVGGSPAEDSREEIVRSQILEQIARLLLELSSPPSTLSAAWLLLDQQMRNISGLLDLLSPEVNDEVKWWARAYEGQLRDHLDDLTLMAPWLLLPMRIMVHPLDEEVLIEASAERTGMLSQLQAELLRLDSIPSLGEIPEMAFKLVPMIDQILGSIQGMGKQGMSQEERDWFLQLGQMITEASDRAIGRKASIEKIAEECSDLAEIEFDLLFDESRKLLAIGYNVNDSRRDESCYDLLASEARLCSYVAIAQGRLKLEHWFVLGRSLTSAGGELALLSWGGTMFEYLMPLLIMPTYENSLLKQVDSGAADRIW
jgi:hypothetical protein